MILNNFKIGEIGAQKQMISYFRLTKFKYTYFKGSMFLFSSQLTRAIGGFFLIPLFLKYFKTKEWILCAVLLPLQLGFYFMFAFAKSEIYIYIGILCY